MNIIHFRFGLTKTPTLSVARRIHSQITFVSLVSNEPNRCFIFSMMPLEMRWDQTRMLSISILNRTSHNQNIPQYWWIYVDLGCGYHSISADPFKCFFSHEKSTGKIRLDKKNRLTQNVDVKKDICLGLCVCFNVICLWFGWKMKGKVEVVADFETKLIREYETLRLLTYWSAFFSTVYAQWVNFEHIFDIFFVFPMRLIYM